MNEYENQVIIIGKDDIILANLSDNIDVNTAREIQKSLETFFPDNKVSIINKNIITSFTIMKNDDIERNPFLC